MLIFLDIDGVMVPSVSWKPSQILEDGFAAFSQKAIDALNTLISDKAKIILTTSHKSRFTIDEWKKIFKTRGIEVEKMECLEANADFALKRKEEILRWFNTHSSYGDFIIIDDDKSLNGLPPHLKARLILTSPLIGLTNEHLTEVRTMLGPSPHLA